MLVEFIRNEVERVGFSNVVLGLSGGIDSAVSAFLAAEALSQEHVWAILMPYKSSSPQSIADAKEVVEATGIHSTLIEITPMIDAYFKRYPDASRLRMGNKMARERMTILYDHSSLYHALVLGTSNKTELLLGYGTIFGDMASSINPIGDLYKTQIWQLAEALGVPKHIIMKKPSADLWTGQTDEDELGFTYEDVDTLLYYMVDRRYSRQELIELGFKNTFVDRIHGMLVSSQYKRRLPVIAKVSYRTIDRDFRYARDWET